MTIDRLLLDMPHAFSPGQAYVGLSRCKSLEGLYLGTFKTESIYCNQRVHAFYKSLWLSDNFEEL